MSKTKRKSKSKQLSTSRTKALSNKVLNFAKVKFIDDNYKTTIPIDTIDEFSSNNWPDHTNDFDACKVYTCNYSDVNNPEERKYGIQIGGFYETETEEKGRGHFHPLEASVIDRYYATDSPNPDEAFDKEEAEKKSKKKKQAKTKQNQDQQNQKSIIAKKKLLIENDNLKFNSVNAEQSKVNSSDQSTVNKEQNKANDGGKNKSSSADSFQKCEDSFPKALESTFPLSQGRIKNKNSLLHESSSDENEQHENEIKQNKRKTKQVTKKNKKTTFDSLISSSSSESVEHSINNSPPESQRISLQKLKGQNDLCQNDDIIDSPVTTKFIDTEKNSGSLRGDSLSYYERKIRDLEDKLSDCRRENEDLHRIIEKNNLLYKKSQEKIRSCITINQQLKRILSGEEIDVDSRDYSSITDEKFGSVNSIVSSTPSSHPTSGRSKRSGKDSGMEDCEPPSKKRKIIFDKKVPHLPDKYNTKFGTKTQDPDSKVTTIYLRHNYSMKYDDWTIIMKSRTESIFCKKILEHFYNSDELKRICVKQINKNNPIRTPNGVNAKEEVSEEFHDMTKKCLEYYIKEYNTEDFSTTQLMKKLKDAQRLNKDTAKLVKGDLTAEAEATKTVINSEDVDKVQPLEFIDDMNKKLESSTILEENDSIKPAKRAGSMIDGESSNAKIPKFLHSTKVGIVHTSEIPTNKSMESITSTKIDSDLKINELHDAVKVNKKESSEKKIKELTIKLSKALKDAKKFESKWKDEKNNNLEYRETIRKKNDELKSVRDLNHQWQFKVLEKVDDYAKAEVNPFTSIIKSDASIGTLRLSNRTGDERPVMMMHCGNNIWIEEVAYHNAKNKGANAKNTFSQFVKEIACSIIGIEGLTEATPTGKPCNRTIKAKQKAGIEVKAKKKIDPILLGAVYDKLNLIFSFCIFKHYLAKEKNMDPIQAAAELKKVHSYLSQKNHDLNSKKIAKNGPNSDKKKKTRVNKRSKKMQKDKEESESEEEDGSDEMNEFKENSKKKDGNNTNEESEDTGQKNKDKDKDSSSSSSSSEAESRDSDMDIE
ncbi:hypothetical protein TKK_0015516 [Trichogramma kaykai]